MNSAAAPADQTTTVPDPLEQFRPPAKRARLRNTAPGAGSSKPPTAPPPLPPPNWERVFTLTREMRACNAPAPVDTMGCERLADPSASPADQRFQTLVSLMLSSQTKDAVTAAAVARLQAELPGGLSVPSILAAAPAALDGLIGKVGFHNTKTRHMQRAAAQLRDRHGGDVPATLEGLLALPGVGPKMAFLTLSAAWGRDEGIGVDVHVHRITNRWGWHATATPERTREALQAWLPRSHWHEINHMLVGFGQTVCLPVGRRCGECVLSVEGLCPSAVVAQVPKSRTRAVAKVEVEVEERLLEGVKIEGETDGEALVSKEEEDRQLEPSMKQEEVDVGYALPQAGTEAAISVHDANRDMQDMEDIGSRFSHRSPVS